MRQLLALALARSGAPRAAIPVLERLREEGHVDEETVGLLARAHKDLWASAADEEIARHHLGLAFQFYDEAHRLTHGIWSGINAAVVALLLGRRDEARAIARDVRDRSRAAALADVTRASDYWHVATQAEADLILGDLPAAEDAYARAAEIGKGRAADTASTRRNARLIIGALGIDGSRIERGLRAPRVVAFSGHLIDRVDRAVPRFPPALEDAVSRAHSGAARDARSRLRLRIRGVRRRHSVSRSDRRSRRRDDDRAAGTGAISSKRTASRSFLTARGRPAIAAPSTAPPPSSSRRSGEWVRGRCRTRYANLLIDGLAGLRGDALDTEVIPLVLWDGRAG